MRQFLLGLGAITILSTALPIPSIGQVTIRERVTIAPWSARRSQVEDFPTTFVSPQSGVLGVIPRYVSKIYSDLPSTEYLEIQIRDTTYHLPLLPVLPDPTTTEFAGYYSLCPLPPHLIDPFFQYERSVMAPTAPLDTFYLGRVSQGDTVGFSYHGEFENPLTYVSPNRRECTMDSEDPCLQAPAEFPPPRESCTIEYIFADTVLRFQQPSSDSLYPTYQGVNNETDKCNIRDLVLRVSFGDSSVRGAWVRYHRPTVVDSGGHSHGGARPRGMFRLVNPPGATWVDTILACTDSVGLLRLQYRASQFTGLERIKASLLSDSTRLDTLRLLTRVPGLQLLPNGANYSKIGGNCLHHGPGGAGDCSNPDNNHWATAGFLAALTSIADQWAVRFPNEPRLSINDLSLPLGGGFDASRGMWEADLVSGRGHQTHRQGKNADLRTAYPNVRSGINIRDEQSRVIRDTEGHAIGNRRFNTICRGLGVRTQIDGNPDSTSAHYHLSFP